MANDDIYGVICCGCIILAVVGGMITGDSYRAGQAAAALFWTIVIILLIINWIKKKGAPQIPPQPLQESPGALSGNASQTVKPQQPDMTPSGPSSTSQFCIHCGNRVQQSQNFCENCGKNPQK
jgi:hypothetical protein